MNKYNGQIVILGAGGFIGLSLAKYALRCGARVLCVSKSFQWNLLNINAPHSDIQIIASDVSDVFSYIGKIEESADVIYMAGSTNILKAEIDPENDYILHANSICSFLASLGKIKSIILISSGGAVYGEPLLESSKESDSLRPKSIYGKRNAILETIFASSISKKNIPYTILRVANPYGVDQLLVRRTGLIFSIVRSWIHGKSIILRDSGLQVRDYIHISHFCEFVMLLFTKGLELVPDIINVCSGTSYSGMQVVEIIRTSLKSTGASGYS